MTVRNSFVFLGGHPIIDFLNTEMVSNGEPVDALIDAEALRSWLVEAKLGGKTMAVPSESILKDAKRLRGHIRTVVEVMGASSGWGLT
mgnify:CR=1 FL=1